MPDLTQLGAAAVAVAILLWIVAKIINGDLLPKSVLKPYEDRLAQAETDKRTLIAQNESLARAIESTNEQLKSALELARRIALEE